MFLCILGPHPGNKGQPMPFLPMLLFPPNLLLPKTRYIFVNLSSSWVSFCVWFFFPPLSSSCCFPFPMYVLQNSHFDHPYLVTSKGSHLIFFFSLSHTHKTKPNLMISPLQGVTPRSFPPFPALSCLDLGASLHEAFRPLSKLFFSLHPGVKDLLLLFAGERVPRLDLRMQLNRQLPLCGRRP